MEQLTNSLFHLDAIAVDGDGKGVPFTLSIFDGEGDGYNHFCWLRCRHLRDHDVRITGVDREQAISLAIWLVEDLLSHKGETLVDAGGRRVELPSREDA